MARFQFRLEALLRLRQAHRDERREQLADAYRVQEALRLEQQSLDDQLRQVRRAQSVAPGPLDVDRLLAAQRYEMVLRIEHARLSRQQEAVAAEVDQRRLALVEADRQLRLLEKLRTAQQERHVAEEERLEMKLLDEAAARTALREEP